MSEAASIYIHIPFCRRKCVYCDFYSRTDLRLIPEYVSALTGEVRLQAARMSRPADTLYFGGGTPSLLSAGQVDAVIKEIDHHIGIEKGAEITFEVNPGTISEDYFRDLKSTGINRLSIGVQSFVPEKLSFLKRIHTAGEAVMVIEQARQAGFENIGLDLIYGLPFENDATWIEDLSMAMDIKPSHLSCYMLTFEPSTPLGRLAAEGQVIPADRETLSRLFRVTSQTLESAGYEHYEISNFAKGRKNRSRHNCVYWNMIPYLGLGAAAHAYDGTVRSWNHSSIDAYSSDIKAGRLPVEETEALTRDQQILEMIMLGLRTAEGISLSKFMTCFDIAFEDQFSSVIGQICRESLGVLDDSHFFLTLEGRVRLNSIVEAFAEQI